MILDYAIGEVGLRPNEFWDMTFAEVDIACKGYETRLARLREVERITATAIINANRDSKKHPHGWNPQDIYPLFTDNKQKGEGKYMTADEFNEAKERRKRIVWQTNSQQG